MATTNSPRFELRKDGTIECQTSHLIGLAHVYEHLDRTDCEIRVHGQPVDLTPPASRLPEAPGELTADDYARRQQQWEAMIFWQHVAPNLADNWRFCRHGDEGAPDAAIEIGDDKRIGLFLKCAFERSILLTTEGSRGRKLITAEVLESALVDIEERREGLADGWDEIWNVVFPPSVANAPAADDQDELTVVPAALSRDAIDATYQYSSDRLLWISKDLRLVRRLERASD